MASQLLALFDSMQYLHKNTEFVVLPDPKFQSDFQYVLQFLKSYTGSLGTFNSYRREAERLLQWTWLVQKQTLPSLKRADIELFIRFSQNPPHAWISTQKYPRYLSEGERRIPNPAWRPFVATISKIARQHGVSPQIEHFELSQGAIQEIFAI